MPVITIKVLEGELTWGQTAELVADVTEAAVPFVGEAVRSNVWILVEKVTPKKIAFGWPHMRTNRKVRAMNQWRKEQRNGVRRP